VSAINLETELVASSCDGRICSYTIARSGLTWTVTVPLADLDGHGPMPRTANARRTHVANLLIAAMRGPSDAERLK
jgi:hypothetical protein